MTDITLTTDHPRQEFNCLSKTSDLSISQKDLRIKLIKEVAKTAFIELAVGLIFTGIGCLFVANPTSIAILLISTVAISILNLGIRSLAAYIVYDRACYPENPQIPLEKHFLHFVEWFAPFNFTLISLSTTDVVIHEGGHALASKLLYDGSNTSISVLPFNGGVTKFVTESLSKIGSFLGKQTSRTLVSAAGPAAGILAATVEIGLAHKWQKSHPRLSRYLIAMGCINILNHVGYALSALTKTSQSLSGHDFVYIWRYAGIHPIVSAISMVALPLLVKTTLFVLFTTESTEKI